MDKDELALYVGSKIKELRIKKNMTQADLADALKTTKQSIGRYENGYRRANQDTLFEFADIFDVSIDYFFPKENSDGKVTTKQMLDNVFVKLEIPRQKKVVKFAKSELAIQESYDSKVTEIADYRTEKEYPYYDDAVSAGTGQYIGTSQRETITLPVDFDADYVVPVYGDSMEPEYHDGDYIFIESTVNLNDGEVGVFEYYGATYVKQLVLEDDHAFLHSLNQNGEYEDMKVDADSDFRVLGRVVGRYAE